MLPRASIAQPARIPAELMDECFQKYPKITCVFASPIIFRRLAEFYHNRGDKLPKQIHWCITGGTSLSYPYLTLINSIIQDGQEFDIIYGATEVSWFV